jgi:tetratricopeptide (TPR) repeat protein
VWPFFFGAITSPRQIYYVTELYRRSLYLPALILLMAATWLSYAPGLHGGFLFDDFANLPTLGATGPVDNWPAFWRYITSGHADPTGRPLALLSFLLDAHDWPADPFPFKRSSLILHLFNGILLSALLRRLGRSFLPACHAQGNRNSTRRIDLAAVLGSGLWLLHPLLVSTTLYIVQREAMLCTTFVLIGLLAWLHGRHLLQYGRIRHGLAWMILGLAGCTMLALLSKANGILLPSLALVIELTLFRATTAPEMGKVYQRPNERIYHRAMVLLTWPPSALVATYLIYQGWKGITFGISSLRPWTLAQRLLTEPRVLMGYLQLLWQPRPFTSGLFNDQIQASTSLWSPATTLPALLAVLGLIIGAVLCRRRWSAWAVAILFYFVGQSLESTTISLELYFEHRNYLSAMLLFWPVALYLCGVRTHERSIGAPVTTYPVAHMFKPFPDTSIVADVVSSGKVPSNRFANAGSMVKPMVAIMLLAGLGLMTHTRAELWGDTRAQTELWAVLNPDSPRAQANAASAEISTGDLAHAVARLAPALAKASDQAQLAMNLFDAQCQLGHVRPSMLVDLRRALRHTRDPGPLLVNWFTQEMDRLHTPPCQELSFGMLGELLDAAMANPYLNTVYGRRQDIDYLKGRLALMQGDANTALIDFNRALNEDVRASAALEQAALLGSMGFPKQGLAHLDHYASVGKREKTADIGMPRLHAWVLQRQDYWPKELAHLRYTLQKEAHQTSPIHEPCDPSEKGCAR